MANTNVFRQIYNVLGVAVSPSPATGWMFSSATAAVPCAGTNLLKYIPRVQSASTALVINREEVNQFGQLNRIDQIITSPPDITLNMDYLLLDGYAESLLGFASSGQQTFVSGLIDGTETEKNYFIGVAPEGSDLITYANGNNVNVIGIGNGTVSNYSQNIAIGQIPRASVTINGSNMQTYVGATGKQSPAIDSNTALKVVSPQFSLPVMPSYTGVSVQSALRPGDIILTFPRTGSFGDYTAGVGKINVQSISLSVPVALDNILQMGNPYPVAKKIRFPVNSTLTVDALAADIAEDDTASLFCSDELVDLSYEMRNPSCTRDGNAAMLVLFNGAKLVNRDWNASIGQNSTVRLTYTTQVQGISANYKTQGVVVSGVYGRSATL
jgi:hypothetical protein